MRYPSALEGMDTNCGVVVIDGNELIVQLETTVDSIGLCSKCHLMVAPEHGGERRCEDEEDN